MVHGLPYSMEWQGLKDLGKEAGRVAHADVVKDRATGRSRGYGIITYDDPRDAARAVQV